VKLLQLLLLAVWNGQLFPLATDEDEMLAAEDDANDRRFDELSFQTRYPVVDNKTAID